MRNYYWIFLILLIGYSCSGKVKSDEDILKKVSRNYIKSMSHRFNRAIAWEEMLDNIHLTIRESPSNKNGLRLYYISYGNSFSDNNIEKISQVWKEGKYYVLFYSLRGPYLKQEDIPKELQRVSNTQFIEEDIDWLVAVCKKNMKYLTITETYNLPLEYIDELNNFSCE